MKATRCLWFLYKIKNLIKTKDPHTWTIKTQLLLSKMMISSQKILMRHRRDIPSSMELCIWWVSSMNAQMISKRKKKRKKMRPRQQWISRGILRLGIIHLNSQNQKNELIWHIQLLMQLELLMTATFKNLQRKILRNLKPRKLLNLNLSRKTKLFLTGKKSKLKLCL